MKWISKISKSCFISKGYYYKKYNDEYIVYHTSNIFWIENKYKLISCKDINDINEIDKRLKLGIKCLK
jgi:hypothetical protein